MLSIRYLPFFAFSFEVEDSKKNEIPSENLPNFEKSNKNETENNIWQKLKFGAGKPSQKKHESSLRKVAKYMKHNNITDLADALHKQNILSILKMWPKLKQSDREQRLIDFFF